MARVAWLMLVSLAVAPSALAAVPPSPEAARANELLEAGDIDAARRIAEPLASGTAPQALALQVLARIARREGRTEDAVGFAEAAVAADPSSSDASLHLGGTYVDQIRTVRALKQLGLARRIRTVIQRAVDLDPASCDARRALAEFYLEAPKIAGGSAERARLEGAQFRERCGAHGHLALAIAAQTGGDLEGAEAACLKALRAEPNLAEGFAMLGWIERLQGVDATAPPTAASRDLLAAAPAWHRSLHEAGRAGILPGPKIEKAEGVLRAAIKREKAPAAKARRRWALGLAHQIRGDRDAAWRDYSLAIALAPDLDLAVRGRDSLKSSSLSVTPDP